MAGRIRNAFRSAFGYETEAQRVEREAREVAEKEKTANELRRLQREEARNLRGFPGYLAKQPIEVRREQVARNAAARAATISSRLAGAAEGIRLRNEAREFYAGAAGAGGDGGAASALAGRQRANSLAAMEETLARTPPYSPPRPVEIAVAAAPPENRPQVVVPNIVIEAPPPATGGRGATTYRPPSAVGFRPPVPMSRAGSPTMSVMPPTPLTHGGKRKTVRRRAGKSKSRRVRRARRAHRKSRRN